MDYKTYQEIVEIIEGQRSIISKQLDLITKLVNENAEKENFIKTLWKEEVQNFLDADEIEERYPDEWEKWLAAPVTYTPPTIDAVSDFKARVNYGLRWLLDHTMENDVVFIVAHLGSIRIIYQELVDPTADFYSLKFPASCYSIINIKNGIVQNWYLNQ